MVKKVEIYFRDLNPDAQSRVLKEFQTTAEEENWDVFPIAEIERELEANCQEFHEARSISPPTAQTGSKI